MTQNAVFLLLINIGVCQFIMGGLLVDFQTRATPVFIESAKRVQKGAIGKCVLGQIYYHAPTLFNKKAYADPKDPSQAARLRNWTFAKAL